MTLKEYFPGIPTVSYEGSYASHPFSFKFYDPERIVAGKPMREHLRFSLPFGAAARFGLAGSDYLLATMELLHKLGVEYYSASDRDLAAEGGSLRESHARLDEAADALLYLQEAYNLRPMQLSVDLRSHPRYSYGAATSYSADIFAFAAAQAKKALETAQRLRALQFCFSGEQERREGFYPSVNDALEADNLARLLHMLGSFARQIAFAGELAVRPCAGVADAYWPDAGQALAFLRCAGLEESYRVDLPGGASCTDLRALLQADRLGSMYVHSGPGFYAVAAPALFELLRCGGLRAGGILLDMPLHQTCVTPEDYCIGCIMYMDAYAYGLLVAHRVLLDGRVEQFRRERYSGFAYGVGKAVLENRADLALLETHALQKGDPQAYTGRAEYLENVMQGLLCRGV